MAKTNRLISFEVESNRTLTDLTPFVKSVSFSEVNPLTVSLWRHPVLWLKGWRARRELRRLTKNMKLFISKKGVIIDVAGTYIPNPWKWN